MDFDGLAMMRYWLRIMLICGATKWGIVTGLCSDWVVADPLALINLLDIAESHNTSLTAAKARWRAEGEKAKQAASLPDPMLSYGQMSKGSLGGDVSERSLGIEQTFPLFDKRTLRSKTDSLGAEAQHFAVVKVRLRLAQDLTEAYYNYAYLHASVILNRQHLELLKAIESVALIKYKSGDIDQNVLLQLQIEQGRLEDQIVELENLRKPLSTQIYALLGDSRRLAILPWPEKMPQPLDELDLEAMLTRLPFDNPELLALTAMIEAERTKVRLARKEAYPDVTLGIEHSWMEMERDATSVMLSLNLPLWRERIKAGIREATERQISLEAEKQDRENTLRAEWEMQSHYYRDAKRKVTLYQSSLIPKAQQAIDVALKGFEAGRVSYADLLDAERSLLELKLASVRQSANALTKVAALQALCGYNNNNPKEEIQ